MSTPGKTFRCSFSELVLSCYYNANFISTLNLPCFPFTGEFVSNSVREGLFNSFYKICNRISISSFPINFTETNGGDF